MIRHEAEPGTEQARLLVVDDNDVVRRAIVRLLEESGYQLCEASGAVAALAMLHENGPVDLVLSDLQMPERDGVALLADLQTHFPNTAVIMLTGAGDSGAAAECLAKGAADFVLKPISSQELHARVAKALMNRSNAMQIRELQLPAPASPAPQYHSTAGESQEIFLAQLHLAVSMLEAKDPYTKGHSNRVAEYAVATGQAMGLPQGMLEQLRLGAALHDIGKIGTRDAVLHKPGTLTDEEFAEVRRHTIAGEEMLLPLRGDFPEIPGIARWHHERPDGKGFPDRLKGDEIPMTARIVAAVDAFDAMTTTRAYRSHQDHEFALTELIRGRGTQFDADVIDAFAQAVKKFV